MSWIDECQSLVSKLPCALMTCRAGSERRGALLYAGNAPTDAAAMVLQWTLQAVWMLENSAVAVRCLPTGKYVALAYRGGHIIISKDIASALSDDMRRACAITTYEEMNISRENTCLIFTQTPFELVLVEEESQCCVFLVSNPKADIVVFSPSRLSQIG